jgi:hypothetical protein
MSQVTDTVALLAVLERAAFARPYSIERVGRTDTSGHSRGRTSLGSFDADFFPQRTRLPWQGTPFKAICPGLLYEYTTDGVLRRDRHYWRAPVGRLR